MFFCAPALTRGWPESRCHGGPLFRQGVGRRNGPLLMLLMLMLASTGAQDALHILGSINMRILLSPAPFVGICGLHCPADFGFGNNVACFATSSHGHFVDFSKLTYLSACRRLSLPILCRQLYPLLSFRPSPLHSSLDSCRLSSCCPGPPCVCR